jgi:hypothetical protein
MPWKETTIMSQKEKFVKCALKKEDSLRALCREFQISRETGYKLLSRYERAGLQGLESQSRAPQYSLSTMSPYTARAVPGYTTVQPTLVQASKAF